MGAETQVNSYIDGVQQDPSLVVLSDGGWVISWGSIQQDESYSSIYQQRFASDGNPVGDEARVSTVHQWERETEMVALPDGGWLVSWATNFSAGNLGGIYFQRYAADGTAVGSPQMANTFSYFNTNSDQSLHNEQELAVLADGGWIITWTSSGQDNPNSSDGVYQQRFDANGNRVGEEDLVNDTVWRAQNEPDVVALEDGGWLVIWRSQTTLVGDDNIMAKRYLANGDALGEEVVLNTYLPKQQYLPDADLLNDGTLVVTWTSLNQTLSGADIFQDRFLITPAMMGTENADTITASSDGNILVGEAGDDILLGGDGKDILLGGHGEDTLTGGANVDVFVFREPGETDWVTDFTAGTDYLDLRGLTEEDRDTSLIFGDLSDQPIVCFDFSSEAAEFVFAVQNGQHVEVFVADTLEELMHRREAPNIVLEDVLLTDLGADDFIF